MFKLYLLILGTFLPSYYIIAQENLYVSSDTENYTLSHYNESSFTLEGLYLSDKMFDVREEKYTLKKFKDVESLDKYINTNIPFFAPCFEFKPEQKIIIKQVRSKQSKKREWRHPTAVDGINWTKIDEHHYILTVRVRYLSSNCNFLEKAIYHLSADHENKDTYILERKEYLEFEHNH